MNLLLDTHVALWALADSPRLSDRARALIESPAATVWVSAATVVRINSPRFGAACRAESVASRSALTRIDGPARS